MKYVLLAGVAGLLLATGAAHANHQAYYQCGKDRIWVNMGKGFSDYTLVYKDRPLSGRFLLDKRDLPLPSRFFRWNWTNGILRYRGRKCEWIDPNILLD